MFLVFGLLDLPCGLFSCVQNCACYILLCFCLNCVLTLFLLTTIFLCLWFWYANNKYASANAFLWSATWLRNRPVKAVMLTPVWQNVPVVTANIKLNYSFYCIKQVLWLNPEIANEYQHSISIIITTTSDTRCLYCYCNKYIYGIKHNAIRILNRIYNKQ